MSNRLPFTQSLTVASGDTLSGVVNVGGLRDLGLLVPTVTSGQLFIRTGVNSGQETRVFAEDGSAQYAAPVAAGSIALRLASIADGFQTLQVETENAQTDSRIFTVIGRPPT